jgi:ribosome-binding factor A
MAHNVERLASLIREEISETMLREVKDPRLSGIISITRVDVAQDMKYARVFVSALVEKDERQKIVDSLSNAAGFMRSELARKLRLRHTPVLDFRWDDSIEHGAHILELLDRVKGETYN